MKTLVTVVGARPQFIKSAPVSLALAQAGIQEMLVHTGQHYDSNMSDIFFDELGLAAPDFHLGIGSGGHGYQTGEGLKGIEAILLETQPDAVLVYGDTNATLSGALAAAKLHIPVAHVEAGLRSFNRRMPEEINRVLTDHVSTWLFVPTTTAIENLKHEGITTGVFHVGDVMLDAVRLFAEKATPLAVGLLDRYQLTRKGYLLLTMHRAETTDQTDKVREILTTLDGLGQPVLFPVHPRIRPLIAELGPFRHIQCIEPLSYLEMLMVEQHAEGIVTDSGGVQKEAAFFEVPCITLRNETEWVETVTTGWNQLVGLSTPKLLAAIESRQHPAPIHALYGNGQASQGIVHVLVGNTVQPLQKPGAMVETPSDAIALL